MTVPRLRDASWLGWIVAAMLGCSQADHPPIIGDTPRGGSRGTGEAGAGGDADPGAEGGHTGMPLPPDPQGCQALLPSTGFCFDSEDEFVADGGNVTITPANGEVTLRSGFWGGVIGSAAETGDDLGWSFEFQGPKAKFFRPGTYSMTNFEDESAYISIGPRGCSSYGGAFQVSELEWDPWGLVTRFAATFEHHCLSGNDHDVVGPSIRGALNFNARGEPDAAPADPSDCKVATPIGFCQVNQVGNRAFREEGGPVSLTPEEAVIEAYIVHDGLQIQASSPDFLDSFLVEFQAPEGETLKPGKYENAQSPEVAGFPYMSTCNQARGAFQILALETEPAEDPADPPTVLRADVDYHFTCSGMRWEAYAKFRYQRP